MNIYMLERKPRLAAAISSGFSFREIIDEFRSVL